MEMRYVPIMALDARESTALKATVLPILISDTMKVKTIVATIAFTGTWNRGLTCRRISVSMVKTGTRNRSLLQFQSNWRTADRCLERKQTSAVSWKPGR